jgi:hypothetical protein
MITSTTLPGKDSLSHAPTDFVRKSVMTLVASRCSCQDGEGSYTAGETRNTKMIRRKPKLKHRHHEWSREILANTAVERNFPDTRLHITLVSVDESLTIIADETPKESRQRTNLTSQETIRETRKASNKEISATPTERSVHQSHQDESAMPTERAGHYPNNTALPPDVMSATSASDDKSTHEDIASTEHPDEASDVSEEWSVDPELDPNIPKVDCSLLAVVKSQFRADNGKGHIADVGRGLTCHSHIIPQQEISTFVGKAISAQAVLNMSADRRSYVIDMSTPLTGLPTDTNPPKLTMLDCYEMSKGASPTSLASMANCPTRLYDRVLDDSYGKEDANAAVQIVVRDGHTRAILYATKHINSGEEILWNYPESWEKRGYLEDTGMCLVTAAATDPFDSSYAILDTASSTHVCKSRNHAHNMVPCNRGSITGIQSGTKGNTYDHSCTFIDKQLGPTPYMPSASANIVSVAAARDHGMGIAYVHANDEFVMTSTNGAVYTFGRIVGVRGKSRFYVMDLSTLRPPPLNVETQCLLLSSETQVHPSIHTVKINRLKYTKRENRDSDRAREFVASIGYPSERVSVKMARGMSNCHVKSEDIRRCFDIHGVPVQRVKGTTTQKKSKSAVMELGVTTVQKEQTAEVDLMFVRGAPFIIVILTPLEFSFTIPLPDKSVASIAQALDKILIQCKQKGFLVQWVRSDNEPALCTTQVASALAEGHVSIDKAAPGQHAPRVERRIGFVKAKYRTIVSTTPYSMTAKLMVQGVIAANRYCNMQKSASSTSDLSPREKFLGRQLDYVRDVGPPFGTYCQATVPNTNNSDAPRTEACIALYPRESQTGSMVLMRIRDSRVITRANAIALPMPDALITQLNREAQWDATPEVNDEPSGDIPREEQYYMRDDSVRTVTHQPVDLDQRGITPSISSQSYGDHQEGHTDDASEDYTESAPEHDHVNTSPARLPSMNMSPARLPSPSAYSSPQADSTTETRRSSRLQQAAEALEVYWEEEPDEEATFQTWLTDGDQHYTMMTDTSNMTCRQAETKLGDAATKSIRGELQQLVDKGFAKPIMPKDVTGTVRGALIRTKMFIKAKTLADGRPGKVKSRLVARGDMQKKEQYVGEDLSASTPDCMSVFAVIAIAASEHRHIMAADIGGAYLNAPMDESSPAVYISIEPRLAQILGDIDPAYRKAIQPNGTVIAKLKKCLYGCIESAKRWQTHVVGVLVGMGFERNVYDECILNKTTKNGQITVLLYVDDLLITSRSLSDVHAVRDAVIGVYKDVKSQDGPKVDFLGMSVDVSTPGTARITMDGMVEKIIADSLTDKLEFVTRTPAGDDLFDTLTESPLLDETRRRHFHTMTARLQYLSRRTRPDIQLSVAMLATRVTKATEIDQCKLDRIIRYLHQSHVKGQRGIDLTPGEAGIQPFGYFDASYGVHVDGKSHTGSCITIGTSGPICTESVRQTIVTKSSTEAELVALSDSANQLIHVRNLLIAQGYSQPPATIYQDNMSCMSLVDRGKPSSKRSRHIAIRYFWIHDRVDTGEVRIIHRPTELMGPANVLTKPTQGAQFIDERFQLTNWGSKT